MIQLKGSRFIGCLFALLALLSGFCTYCWAQVSTEPVVKQTTSDRLKSTIVYLSETIGERNLRNPAKLAEASVTWG
jgi:hypothetical protein